MARGDSDGAQQGWAAGEQLRQVRAVTPCPACKRLHRHQDSRLGARDALVYLGGHLEAAVTDARQDAALLVPSAHCEPQRGAHAPPDAAVLLTPLVPAEVRQGGEM